jgi:hypothetical protein
MKGAEVQQVTNAEVQEQFQMALYSHSAQHAVNGAWRRFN